MRTFNHVLYTWLLANIILLVIWLIMYIAGLPGGLDSNIVIVEISLVAFGLLLVSLPSLFAVMFFINAIIPSRYPVIEKLLLWYIATAGTAILNIVLPLTIIAGTESLNSDLMFLSLPAIGAVFLSITIRYKYFLKLNKSLLQKT